MELLQLRYKYNNLHPAHHIFAIFKKFLFKTTHIFPITTLKISYMWLKDAYFIQLRPSLEFLYIQLIPNQRYFVSL